ncbi:sigma-54-dependent transcriptional regulator [Pseudoalteromonas fenneropenaei]|uniref:Sigma-54-dependent transcriptional regulator n=1 Tax=Pseudoalteromonas fenneropenaei TaxID=1737459 RepID=A0ABV7CG76_9GAMM
MSLARILVVDDDVDFSELLAIRIGSFGYEVSTAHRATLALQQLEQQHFDLVLTDLRMANMDGMALFTEIRKRFAGLPVVMMTAHGSIPDAVQATQQGMAGFLTKPIDTQALQDTLATCLKGRQQATLSQQSGEFYGLYYQSEAMHQLAHKLATLAQSHANVLIQGESGTGKEVTANAIHRASQMAGGPFVAINCGAVPAQLLESELFGHVKGAFTGATQDKLGLVQSADRGTLFLDEIADMPLELQVKLLRVLQERKVRPVGSQHESKINVRFLSASHKDLWQAVQQGQFREDLYYRLNVVSVTLPALRERPQDIPYLANHFLHKLADKQFAPAAMTALLNYRWPGNIRQLSNVIEHCVALTAGKLISENTVRAALPGQQAEEFPGLNDAKRQFELDYIKKVMSLCQGNVAEAAKLAKRNRSDFYKLLKKHNIPC